MAHFCKLETEYCYCRIPGSSKCVKFVPFHPKNLPKGRNFTYLEDPGMFIVQNHRKRWIVAATSSHWKTALKWDSRLKVTWSWKIISYIHMILLLVLYISLIQCVCIYKYRQYKCYTHKISQIGMYILWTHVPSFPSKHNWMRQVKIQTSDKMWEDPTKISPKTRPTTPQPPNQQEMNTVPGIKHPQRYTNQKPGDLDKSKYINWKVHGTVPMYWFIWALY